MFSIKMILAHPDRGQLKILETLKRFCNDRFRMDMAASCDAPNSLYSAIIRHQPSLIIMDASFLTPCINTLSGGCDVICITQDRSCISSSNIHYAYVPLHPPEIFKLIEKIYSNADEDHFEETHAESCRRAMNRITWTKSYFNAIDSYCLKNRCLLQNGISPMMQRETVIKAINGDLLYAPKQTVKAPVKKSPHPKKIVWERIPEKRIYECDENLFLRDGIIRLWMSDGSYRSMSVSDSMVTPVDLSVPGEKQVMIHTHGLELTLKIEVVNTENSYPVVPELQRPASAEKTDADESVVMKDESPLDLTVEDENRISNLFVASEPEPLFEEPKEKEGHIMKLEFLRPPAQTSFVVGEIIHKQDLLVKAVASDGSFDLIQNFELVPDRPLRETDHEVMIRYSGEELSYPIHVVNKTVLAMVITTMPKKLEYIQGSHLDLAGGMITLFYSDSTNVQIEMTSDMAEGFNEDQVGKQLIKINCQGQTQFMQVIVREKKLVGIEVMAAPEKTDYTDGEKLDLTGLVLKTTYDNGDCCEVRDYQTDEIRVKKDQAVVKLPFENLFFPVFIHVKNYQILGIEMEQLPDHTKYLMKRDMMDVTGGKVAKILSNGEKEIVPLELHMISGFSNQMVGPCKVAVNLENFQCFFTVDIIAPSVEKLEVIHAPNKVIYFEKEEFEPEGIIVRAQYNNNTFTRITDFSYEPKILNCDTYTVDIMYAGKRVSVPVQVRMRMVESISISKMPDKLTFKEGKDYLDVSGGKLLILYNNNAAETIDMFEDMVEGFDNLQPGDNLLTIRYQDKTTQYQVVIEPKNLIGLAVTKPPDKIEYEENELFDPSGMILSAFYDNSTMSELKNYAIEPDRPLTQADSGVFIKFMDKMAIVPILVTEKKEPVPDPEPVSDPGYGSVIQDPVTDLKNDSEFEVHPTEKDDSYFSQVNSSVQNDFVSNESEHEEIMTEPELVPESSVPDVSSIQPTQKEILQDQEREMIEDISSMTESITDVVNFAEPEAEEAEREPESSTMVLPPRFYAGTGDLRFPKEKSDFFS